MQSEKVNSIRVDHVTKKYNIYNNSSDRVKEIFDFRVNPIIVPFKYIFSIPV